MRIRYTFRGIQNIFDQSLETAVIGRPDKLNKVDLDLTPDTRASRSHARITAEGAGYWLEDVGSTHGTKLDGHQIKKRTKIALLPGQVLQIGETELVLEADNDTQQLSSDSDVVFGKGETVIDLVVNDSQLEIGETINVSLPNAGGDRPLDTHRAQSMARLYQLPLEFNESVGLNVVLQRTIEELVQMIPSARRGALLLKDRAQREALLLMAHLPPGEPSVSLSLLRRAMAQREGFIWSRPADPSRSQIANRMQAGMYVPLQWRDEILGVICIDNNVGGTGTAFENGDLHLLNVAAHHIAASVMQAQLQEELRRNSAMLNRLLASYSPRTREHLLRRAHHGRLQLGGERSEIAILESDVRGFTKLTAGMDADDVVALLNDYFAALVEALSRFGGTVDKFVGDAILAVFFENSEGEPKRHANALAAASAMQEAMAEVTTRRLARGQAVCSIGIGVHCGEVLHGFIGSQERMELTVIGDAVNLTSRYCASAEGGQILMSPMMHRYTWNIVDATPVTIASKHEGPLEAFLLRGLKPGFAA